VEATASRSCTLPRVHSVLDITCIEHPSMSAGQELSGHCLGTTSSQDHTSVCSTKQLSMRGVPHSPYMSTERECLEAVCSRTPSLDHTYVCMRRGQNSKEIISAVDEAGDKVPGGLQGAQVLAAQRAQFGDLGLYIEANDALLLGEDRLQYRVLDGDDIQLVIPDYLRLQVLNYMHRSRAVGHWGVLRTSARMRQRYWWHGWKSDVEKSMASCQACSLTKQNPARRQAKMRNWHPRSRFHTVATDVTEISPTSSSGCSKVAVVGDLFTRFMDAVPLRDEKAETIAEVSFDRGIAICGPPLRLLSDQGKPFVSAMVKYLCAKEGTEKIETAPYHPQSDGCVECSTEPCATT
jgi:hypothetical protein